MSSFEFTDGYGSMFLDDCDGGIWVLAQPVYEKLGYKNGTKEVNKNVSTKNRRTLDVPKGMRGRNGRPTRLFLNQEGVMELILKAQKMPAAKEFQEWFFKKVVPQAMNKFNMNLPATNRREIVSLDDRYGKALRMLYEGQQQLAEQNREIISQNKVMSDFIKSFDSVIKIDGMNWRDAARYIVTVNSKKNGTDYSASYHEIYAELEKTMGVKLSVRRTNMQKKTGKKNIALLDVVAADKKLVPTFISILRMYALKHGIQVEIKPPEPDNTTNKKGVA